MDVKEDRQDAPFQGDGSDTPLPGDEAERGVPSADFTIDPTKLKIEDKKLGQGSFGVVSAVKS